MDLTIISKCVGIIFNTERHYIAKILSLKSNFKSFDETRVLLNKKQGSVTQSDSILHDNISGALSNHYYYQNVSINTGR